MVKNSAIEREAVMRYRRMHYRYAVVLAAEQPRPIGDAWRTERPAVTLARTCWRPPADVYESAQAVTVTVELAGVDAAELDVVLFDDALVVEGQRRLPPPEPSGVYHAAEIRQGHFRLDVSLPAPIDPERAEAHYDRGLLQMTLAKAGGDGNGR
jgi:HSP20 family protein